MWSFQRLFAQRFLSRGTPVLGTNILYKQPINIMRQFSTTLECRNSWPVEFIPTCLSSKTHPLGWETLQKQVEPFFEQNWDFASEKERNAVFSIGFSRALSELFPLTLDSRVYLTGKMHYLVLLMDDQMDKMEMSGLQRYRERVMEIARGEASPDEASCLEWILHDTLNSMRSIDEPLANNLAEGICILIQGQTTQNRLTVEHLGPYLEYREVDVGISFYPALIRFGANLHLTPAELRQAAALESYAFRFFGAFNDVYSWEKEWKTYQENQTDGAQPFSSISILAKDTCLSYPACKRMMLVYCRELELEFKKSVELIHSNHAPLREDMIKYIQALEYMMSGVESWTKWTPRYR